MEGDYERFLHFVFSDLRERGEWFDFKTLDKNQILEVMSFAIDYRKDFKECENSCDVGNDYTAAQELLKIIGKKK